LHKQIVQVTVHLHLQLARQHKLQVEHIVGLQFQFHHNAQIDYVVIVLVVLVKQIVQHINQLVDIMDKYVLINKHLVHFIQVLLKVLVNKQQQQEVLNVGNLLIV
jgi:hypothetical protein